MIDREKKKLERIEARKQQLLDRPNPYQKEIDTCERLIALCDKLKVDFGLAEQPKDVVIKEEQKQIINNLAKEEMQKKLQDGKLERVLSKKEREEQANI